MNEPILEFDHLSVSFLTRQGEVEALRDLSLSLHRGEVLAIVGESGSGKSVLCKAAMKLLSGNAVYKQGQIRLNGENIVPFSETKMRSLRGRIFSMIFQDPMLTLDPTMPIGSQIMEAIFQHQKATPAAARARALELLQRTGIPEPEERFDLQPHFFSGGMRQRCVLAAALAAAPEILFADEPTTALDVTLQAQMIDLIKEMQKELALSVLFISHDLSVVARIADRVAVMYAGKIIEIGTAEDIFYDPRHPYTRCLLKASPASARRGQPLYSIPGMPPSLLHPPQGDAFAPRNPYAMAIDYKEMPPFYRISDTHSAATWLLDERAPRIAMPELSIGKEDCRLG